jgi:hypothetical protein
MNTFNNIGKCLLACTLLLVLHLHTQAVMTSAPARQRLDAFTRTFRWDFEGCTYEMSYQIPWKTYHYYQEKPRVFHNYAVYTHENPAHAFLGDFVQTLRCQAEASGLNRAETMRFVITFVQHLEYRNDQGEYPKFPIETVAEFGGDCEDTSLLLAAMLEELGYETVLINPPGHMAIAMACDDCSGVAYHSAGKRYYYIETTATGFGIGEVPESYRNTTDKIMPLTVKRYDLWVLHDFVPRKHASSEMLYFVSEDRGMGMATSQRGEQVLAKAMVRSVKVDGRVSTSRRVEVLE